ncbi:hypothetical protein CEW87_09090 [Parazoarcus communis]|uniref:Uncharacterized protein n=1 Tax=Parazoarcus communis TaxID=41977 RepID=A0A2U8H0U3_9RHOO|nr:hypothetical protein CEW87_09090 [Parazoarcus communis]
MVRSIWAVTDSFLCVRADNGAASAPQKRQEERLHEIARLCPAPSIQAAPQPDERGVGPFA